MAEVNEYFPNIKIRTLKSDLENLKQSGGSFVQQKEAKAEKENYLFQEQKKETVIAPPVLEIRQASQKNQPELVNLQQQKIGSIEQIKNLPENIVMTDESASRDRLNSKLVLGLGLGLVLIVGLSLGFWFFYPNLNQPISGSPTPTPILAPSLSPSPSPTAPVLDFKASAEKFAIILNSLETSELAQKIKSNMLLPQPVGTSIIFEPKLGAGEYFSGEDLIKIISPDSLSSFKAAINKNYLMLGYWETENKPNLSLVFTIKPENIEIAKSIVKSWETANMEEYFPIIFSPQPPEKRRTEVFKNVKIANVDARMITINQQKFIYTIIADRLVISPSEKAFELIIKNI